MDRSQYLLQPGLHDFLKVRVPREIGEIIRLHRMQQWQTKLRLLQCDQQRMHALPQTTRDGALA